MLHINTTKHSLSRHTKHSAEAAWHPAIPAATTPTEARGIRRDAIQLLISSDEGHTIQHSTMSNFAAAFQAGDVVVINNSQTIPAHVALDDGRMAIHLSQQLTHGRWVIELRQQHGHTTGPYPHGKKGDCFEMPGGVTAQLIKPYDHHQRLWVATLTLPQDWLSYLHQHGQPIRYDYVQQPWPIEMYQTFVGTVPGSVEMPSASRGLSQAVWSDLVQRGVHVVPITLHCGVSSLERIEAPHAESYYVPAQTVQIIMEAKRAGRRVVAVGTTVLRALESAWRGDRLIESKGWTDLLFSAQSQIHTVDGLLSGFHPPEASHIHVLEAVISRAHITRAYTAGSNVYLSHEFGDVHLMWRANSVS